ncbi:glycosyl-transferase for dystroglycan-domain-containing protein [Paraphysoderma sedebokerense]|nr:glycosyl-transferase for dystroglycan-domain-containing protein [Paraphysoderma sedebokerense]
MLFKYDKGSFPQINTIKVIHFVRRKPWYSKEDQYESKTFLQLFDTPDDYEPLNRLWRIYNTTLHKRKLNNSQCEPRRDNVKCINTWWKSHRKLPVALTNFCFQVFPFYCHASFRSSCRPRPSSTVDYFMEDISLVTQLDIARLRRLKQMTLEWSGPISAAIFVKDDMVNAIHALSLFDLPYDRLDIHLVFIEKLPAPYPINLLRNIAMSNSRTDMVLNLDVDFIVSDGLYERLKLDEKYRHVWENTEKKHAFVVPAFEFMKPRPCNHPAYANVEIPILPRAPTSSTPLPPTSNTTQPSVADSSESSPSASTDTQTPCYAFPQSKQQLLPLIQSRHVLPFHPTKKGHSATLNSRWALLSAGQPTRSELKPYYATWQTWWEPYLIIRKSVPDLPIFNTTFIDRGRNKCVWVFELYVRGFKFVVLPDFWMIHFWESSEGNGDEAIEAIPRPKMNHAAAVYTEIVERERALWNCELGKKECGRTERIQGYEVVEQ